MTNHASKLFFGVAAFGLAASFLYYAVIGDRSGSLLLLGLAVVAVLAGLSVQGGVGRDWAPRVDDDAVPDQRPVDARDVARPSPWPVLAAIGVGDAAIGAAYGAAWFLAGLGVAAVFAVAWLAQTWREHPAWTPHHGERLAQRLIAPLVTPVGTLLIALFVAVMLSRTLLAVSPTASWVAALVIAILVLGALWFVAVRPRVSQGAVLGLAAVGVAGAIGLGVAGATAGEREFHPHEDHVPTVVVEAENIAFDKKRITLPAGVESRIEFANHDEGTWHNISFYTRKDSGKPLFSGQPILSGDVDYTFVPPEQPGINYFVCDFHPNMEGEFVVTEPQPGDEGEHEGDTDEEHDE